MGKIKRVHKNEINKSLEQARLIISDIHQHFNVGKQYKFTERLVGSAKWNIVLKDNDGFYDLDYQLLLTKNSKKIKNYDEKVEKKTEATMIKEDFFNYMNDKYSDREKYELQNSTTAITFINKKAKFSIDFVLIKSLPDNNEAYQKFKRLTPKQKEDVIENHILPRKIQEKKKDKNDPTLISSSRIFKEEVNNYGA